jgi:hypothetical protein
MEREIPASIRRKYSTWQWKASWWTRMHYVTGFSSAALTVFIAANARAQFLSPIQATVLAAIAAGLAFLVTALSAQTKGRGYGLASYDLELAIAKYRHNPDLPNAVLSDAVEKGIETLKGLKV